MWAVVVVGPGGAGIRRSKKIEEKTSPAGGGTEGSWPKQRKWRVANLHVDAERENECCFER